MTEQTTTKQFKLTQKEREYQRQRKRERRIKNWKCKICGAQAWGKPLLTQEPLCATHMVKPLKEELIKQQEEKKKNDENKTQ